MNFSEKSVLVLRSWATPAYKWYWRWCRWASAWRWWERKRNGWEGATRRQPGVPEEEGPALGQDTWWPREGKGRTQSGHPIAVLWGSQMWSYISQIKNLQLPVQKLIHLAPNHSISKDSPGFPWASCPPMPPLCEPHCFLITSRHSTLLSANTHWTSLKDIGKSPGSV